MTRKYEDAARILRGLKERIDHAQQQRIAEGGVNVVRTAFDYGRGVDSETTETGDAADWTWGTSEWDYEEWQ